MAISATNGDRKAIVRQKNTDQIIRAAEEVYALKGFAGATMQEIADKADLPKANIHYYFKTKRALYVAVLEDIFKAWAEASTTFDNSDDPKKSLSDYITSKLQLSFDRPFGSKVWANEIIHGAPVLGDNLMDHLHDWEGEKAIQIAKWAEDGKILPVDPHYLLYMIWATTQHYADFDHQVRVLNGGKALSQSQRNEVTKTVCGIILRGVGFTDV